MTWRERIVRARLRGTFNVQDKKNAASPVTCAWGEMNEKYGLALEHGPQSFADRSIENQGYDFFNAVSNNIPNKAEEILDSIEDKALQIKRSGGLTPWDGKLNP